MCVGVCRVGIMGLVDSIPERVEGLQRSVRRAARPARRERAMPQNCTAASLAALASSPAGRSKRSVEAASS